MNKQKIPSDGVAPSANLATSEARDPKQIGEGSYEGTRDYQESVKSYLEQADVAADAQAAHPANDSEAASLKQAEREGLSHSKARGQ